MLSLFSKGLFVASTGQHVGKTTLCLGLFSGLQKRLSSLCYMKPVGQEHVVTKQGKRVDKDVLIFKGHFSLNAQEQEMSPVVIPQGLTKQYLDGNIGTDHFKANILASYEALLGHYSFLLVEGTGHCGVGSLLNLNNAQVASLLKLPLLLISSGGLGSTFDALALNKALCDLHGVPILGVILNRVMEDKEGMVIHYMKKALHRWSLPLLGCIPYDPFLSHPTMEDFEGLFKNSLCAGEAHRLRHFKHIRLVATSVDTYRQLPLHQHLIITPANREDIILTTLTKHWDYKISHPSQDLKIGMILTGDDPPRASILKELKRADIPMLYTPFHSDTVMQMIHSFTAKIRTEDTEKVHEAITLVENHIDFDCLLRRLHESSVYK